MITAGEIVESETWKFMVESLVKSYFERFIATSSSDTEALLDIRRDLDALHVIDRELRALAKPKRE